MNRLRRKLVSWLLELAFKIYPPVEDMYSDMYKYVAIEATLARMKDGAVQSERQAEDETDE